MTAAEQPADDAKADEGKAAEPDKAPRARPAKPLRITAMLVVVETKDGRVRELYKGDLVTEDVSEKSLKHLKAIGFVAAD